MHNALKDHLRIEIFVVSSPEFLKLTLVDDGIGCDPQKLNDYLNYAISDLPVSNGFGIRNVNERISLHFPNGSGLSYQTTEKGNLAATIYIQYNKAAASEILS